MVFVCATVIEGGSGKVLVPWEIYQCHVESTTILEFCRVTLFCKGHHTRGNFVACNSCNLVVTRL